MRGLGGPEKLGGTRGAQRSWGNQENQRGLGEGELKRLGGTREVGGTREPEISMVVFFLSFFKQNQCHCEFSREGERGFLPDMV